jgi:hypothetical protein
MSRADLKFEDHRLRGTVPTHDLALQLDGDALEFAIHAFDLRDLAPVLVDLKPFQANERRVLLLEAPPISLGRHSCQRPGSLPPTLLVFSFRVTRERD